MGFMPSLFGGNAPLRPNGPAPFAQPSERDRRALFWWLKRNTSVTAIEHNAKLWADFMRDYERWLRAKPDPYPRFVEAMKFGLDTQMRYEKGLERLRRGDRSVFNFKSIEGHLAKLFTSALGDRIEWFDPPPDFIANRDGCTVDLVNEYHRAHEVTMAVGHEISYSALDRPRRAAARPLLASLPFDTTLAEPRWDVTFNPGARAPMDGIYEQIDAQGHIVGGMAYFVKGEKAEGETGLEFGPQSWDVTQKATSDFLWRLLWEDTRYKDGQIPEEERHYQTPSESVAIEHAVRGGANVVPQALRCQAGQPCPREGWWSAPAKPDSRRLFALGEVMPELGTDFGTTIWQWDERQD